MRDDRVKRVSLWMALSLAVAALSWPGTRAQAQPALPAPQSLATPAPSALSPELIAKRMQPCTSCHSDRGRATPQGYFPRIAGKPAGYLFNQLINFRSGRRHFPTMVYFMQLQGDASLRQMAEYFAGQQLPYPPPEAPRTTADVLARGRELAMQGDSAHQLPACAACHGERLLGVQPAVPALLGVSQDYLLGQLGAWRNDSRRAEQPDCMAQIAHRLSLADLAALTAWLASQAVPTDAGPDANFARTPPLHCGSIEPEQALASHPEGSASAGDAAVASAGAAAALVARGGELVRLGDCEACHTLPGGPAFAGGRSMPTRFGTFYAPNITPEPQTGIGRWSAEEFWHAMHEGLAPDGTALYPAFPYPSYTRLTRADVDAMFAYLRTVRPAVQASRAHELRFPYRYRALLAVWRTLYFRPTPYQPDLHQSAQWNRGAYLTQGLAHCDECHGARNALGAVRAPLRPSGEQILGWYAPSLVDPGEAGLQDWSVADIVTLLRAGSVAAGSAPASQAVTSGPMAEVVSDSLQYAPPQDLAAMALYLKSLSATSAAPAPMRRASDEALYEGGQVYARDCAACHGAQGQGLQPVGPPLASNRAVTMSSVTNPIRLILFGGYSPGTEQNPTPFGMPPFSEQLTDAQIAAVLTYIRQSWGNSAPEIEHGAIGPIRGSPL